MKLTPPKRITFWISLAIAVLGLIAYFVKIPFLSDYKFWVVLVAYVLLFLGNFVKGL